MSRVLLVGKGSPDRGGIPSFLRDLQEGELARRHDVGFLNLAHHGTPQGGKASPANIARTLWDAARVWWWGRRYDVVHINSALAPSVTVLRAGLLAAAARMAGAVTVVHAHGGNLETWLTTPRARLVVRTAMRPADAVAAVWVAGFDALARTIGEDRVALIDNGVDVRRFAPRVDEATGPAAPRILYVGLLTPRKGVLDLVEASRMLHEEGLRHELLLLGGTPDEGPAAAQPVLDAAAAAPERVKLLGTRAPDEMPAAYAEADVFCLPSWWEAMPLSVLEAMAAGLPVVASDVGDVSRLVDEGVTGLVVPSRAPDELASALRKLLTDPAARCRMGEAGRRRAEERFSSTVLARQVSELYAHASEVRR